MESWCLLRFFKKSPRVTPLVPQEPCEPITSWIPGQAELGGAKPHDCWVLGRVLVSVAWVLPGGRRVGKDSRGQDGVPFVFVSGPRSRPQDLPSLGASFEARFRLVKKIGEGGTSIVYLAEDKTSGVKVAVKVLDAVGFENDDAFARLREEARLARKLEHPNLVRLFDAGQHGACLYLVYQYVEGEDLNQRIRKERKSAGRRAGMPVGEALAVLTDILRGLEYAHKLEVVHRDLKPANILLDQEGRAHVADFGLAKAADAARQVETATGLVVGTPECMAPEQAMGKPVGTQADIYALGCLFYWMMAGRPPFRDENPGNLMLAHVKKPFPELEEVRPNLDPGLYRMLQEMTRKRPEERPSASDLLRGVRILRSPQSSENAVAEALRSGVIKIRPVGKTGLKPKLLGLGVGILAIALGAVTWWSRPVYPRDVRVQAGARSARLSWRGRVCPIQLRLAEDGVSWQESAPQAVEGGGEIRLEGLRSDRRYEWRFADFPDRIEELRTEAPAQLQGPWPAYDVKGNRIGWVLSAPRGIEILSPSGEVQTPRSDGLLRVESDGIRLRYPSGVEEDLGGLEAPPNVIGGLREFVAAAKRIRVREVLGRAVREQAETSPLLAARRAAQEVYFRWRAIEAALPGVLDRIRSERRYELFQALGKLHAIDRIFQVEGLSDVFGVASTLPLCIPFSLKEQALPFTTQTVKILSSPEEALTGQNSEHSRLTQEVPEPQGLSPGPLQIRFGVQDLWWHDFLEVGVGARKFQLRPNRRETSFRGWIELEVPGELVPEGAPVSLRLRREDLPGLRPNEGRPTGPLFQAGQGLKSSLKKKENNTRVQQWSLTRPDPKG